MLRHEITGTAFRIRPFRESLLRSSYSVKIYPLTCMKKREKISVPPSRELVEDEIRDYAYHLYEQSGCLPHHDLENWLEAKACLEANVRKQPAHGRLHRHGHPEAVEAVEIAIKAQGDPQFDASGRASDDGIHVERVVVMRVPGDSRAKAMNR